MPSEASAMARSVLFRDASSRSLSFFHRTLGVTRRHLELLCGKRKYSCNMGSLTDEQVVEFFLKERIREESKNSLHGEVPDIFRTNRFFIGIEGDNWIHQRDWKEASMSARVYIKNKDSETFAHVLQTETIIGECSPKFTTRIPFGPLRMRDSQNNAITTILRIDAYVKDKRFASVHISLAQLLWDRTYETQVEPLCPSHRARRALKKSKVKLNVSCGRSTDEDVDECQIDFKIQVGRSSWTQVQGSQLFLAVCSVAGYGQWTRLYVSEFLVKPSKKVGNNQFPIFRLGRGDLNGYNHKNPIRIELRGSRKGISVVHGFVQFVLPDTSMRCFLPWNQTRCSQLAASAALEVIVPSPRHLVLSLYIGMTVTEAQEFIYCETEGAKIAGGEKCNNGVEMGPPIHKNSYDSYGSSSRSSEPCSRNSLTDNEMTVVLRHRSEPKYYVRFPSPL